jgi:hypothetical protein
MARDEAVIIAFAVPQSPPTPHPPTRPTTTTDPAITITNKEQCVQNEHSS